MFKSAPTVLNSDPSSFAVEFTAFHLTYQQCRSASNSSFKSHI